METTADVLQPEVTQAQVPSAAPLVHLVRQRRQIAAGLTAFTVLLGVVLVATLGTEILVLFLIGLPVSLWLLWVGSDELRSDER